MKIIVKCSLCGKELHVLNKYGGKRAKCPSCGNAVQIPVQQETPPSIPKAPAVPSAPPALSPTSDSVASSEPNAVPPDLPTSPSPPKLPNDDKQRSRQKLFIGGGILAAVILLGLIGAVIINVGNSDSDGTPTPRTEVRKLRNAWDGSVTETETYEDDAGKLVKHGPEIIRYGNGQKKSEVHFSHGEQDGPAIQWYPNGQQSIAATYKDGVLHGAVNKWYENGEKQYEGSNSNGKLDGAQKHWNPSGELVKLETYSEDVLHGSWMVQDENGQAIKGEYANGRKTGEWTKTHRNGTKLEEGSYQDDVATGVWTFWHDNGQKRTQCEYRNGEVYGFWPSWDRDGKKQSLLKHFKTDFVSSLDFSSDSSMLVAASPNTKTIVVWDLTSGQEKRTLTCDSILVEFLPADDSIAALTRHAIDVWDLKNQRKKVGIEIERRSLFSLDIHPNNTLMVAGSSNGTVTVLDTNTLETRRTITSECTGRDNYVFSVAFSKDGRRLILGNSAGSGQSYGTLEIWEIDGDKQVLSINLNGDTPRHVAIDPDFRFLAGTIRQGRSNSYDLKIWKTDGAELLSVHLGDLGFDRMSEDTDWPVQFEPNGRLLAVGAKASIRIWKPGDSMEEIKDIDIVKNELSVFCLAFSPNGRFLASGGSDGVKLWDISGL